MGANQHFFYRETRFDIKKIQFLFYNLFCGKALTFSYSLMFKLLNKTTIYDFVMTKCLMCQKFLICFHSSCVETKVEKLLSDSWRGFTPKWMYKLVLRNSYPALIKEILVLNAFDIYQVFNNSKLVVYDWMIFHCYKWQNWFHLCLWQRSYNS